MDNNTFNEIILEKAKKRKQAAIDGYLKGHSALVIKHFTKSIGYLNAEIKKGIGSAAQYHSSSELVKSKELLELFIKAEKVDFLCKFEAMAEYLEYKLEDE